MISKLKNTTHGKIFFAIPLTLVNPDFGLSGQVSLDS